MRKENKTQPEMEMYNLQNRKQKTKMMNEKEIKKDCAKCIYKDIKCETCTSFSEYKIIHYAKIWFPNKKTMLLKFPSGFSELELPIRLERTLALVITSDCVEIRNLIIENNDNNIN